jgi:DUF3097, C-terminal domain/DUF3097, N-terminal domain
VPTATHDPNEPDRYGDDVLTGDWRARGRRSIPTLEAERDLVVELAGDGFCGAVVAVDRRTVTLEDRHRRRRMFPLGHGFLVDGEPVQLVAPVPKAPTGRVRTASGSFAVAQAAARVALPSRIVVEGRHDAELVEKVWGADLRVEGIVVEYLEGVDVLAEQLDEFRPGAGRRAGVLVDHLVPGSKEQRIADRFADGPHARHVLVVGHPFIDIWQAVKPSVVGLAWWPDIPHGTPWKEGVCRALGESHPADLWRRILSSVNTYADLDPTLVGAVEELIDFVTGN